MSKAAINDGSGSAAMRMILVGTDDDDEGVVETDPAMFGGYDSEHFHEVEVPAAVADRLDAALKEWRSAQNACLRAARFDPSRRRFFDCCDAYEGDSYTSSWNGVTTWDDCHRCGWQRSEHSVAATAERPAEPGDDGRREADDA